MLRFAALMPLALAACVDSGDEGIFVLTNSAVTASSCSLTGSPDQPQLGHGIINVGSPIAYVMTPLVQSRIQTSTEGGDDISRTVQLRGADIKLIIKAVSIETGGQFTTSEPNTVLPPFSVLFSGAIKPGGSVNAFVNIIPPATLRDIATRSGANLSTSTLQAEVLAQVIIKGDLNGNSIESQPFDYPVTVCNNCVVANLGACPLPATPAPRPGNACNPFQDGVVDCCTDASNNLICPAVTAAM
jgi:hypothetical protein